MTPERLDINGNRIGRRAQNGRLDTMRGRRQSYRNGYRRCKEHGWQFTTETRCTFRGCNRRLKIKSQSSTSRAARSGEEARY